MMHVACFVIKNISFIKGHLVSEQKLVSARVSLAKAKLPRNKNSRKSICL